MFSTIGLYLCWGHDNDDDNMTKGLISKEVVEASAENTPEATQWLGKPNSQRAFSTRQTVTVPPKAGLLCAQTTVIALGSLHRSRQFFPKASTEIWPWGGTNYWSLANVVIPLLILR